MHNTYRDQELKGTPGEGKRILLARMQFDQGRVSCLLDDKFN